MKIRKTTIPSFSLLKILSGSILGLITTFTFTSQVLAQNVSSPKSSLASTILEEINKARTNPIAYADWLESNTSSSTDNSNKAKINQVIDFLRNLQPLPAMQNSAELVKVASQASQNNAENNSYKYINIPVSNDSQIKEIVVSLLSNQTKEDNIFNRATDKTGIACNSSGKKCVVAYAPKTQVAAGDLRENQNSSTKITNDSTSPSSSIPIPISNPESPSKNNSTQSENTEPSASSSNSSSNQENPQTVAATQKYDLLERGILEDGDLVIPSDGSLYDAFVWQGKKGDKLVIRLESPDFDTYLAVQDSKGKIIAENDDLSEGSSNSGLSIVLPKDDTYRLIINSYDPKGRGNYTISVETN